MTILAFNGFGAGTAISFQTLVMIEAKGMENIGKVYGSFSITSMMLFIAVGPFIGKFSIVLQLSKVNKLN